MKPIFSLFLILAAVTHGHAQTKWPAAKANAWYALQPWPVGANFAPASAINQLEMWQAQTFDTAGIARELGWARSLGMNTMRVFLHDLAYEQDPQGFLQRMDVLLRIAQRHGIKPLIVFFDSVWDPYPVAGKQPDPKPHVHNSGWVQSPGARAIADDREWPRLERYVKAVSKRFANDNRIWGWDVWNEPDNMNGGEYMRGEPLHKLYAVTELLPKVFAWVRSQGVVQPLTSGVWWGDWSRAENWKPIWKIQLDNSDIISFHNYDSAHVFEERIAWLKPLGRPIICTEYMARPRGSGFAPQLEIAKRNKIGMYNWGFVSGKSQTIYPWNSWDSTYRTEPVEWFHDIFRTDGMPYRQAEVDYIRGLTRSAAMRPATPKTPAAPKRGR